MLQFLQLLWEDGQDGRDVSGVASRSCMRRLTVHEAASIMATGADVSRRCLQKQGRANACQMSTTDFRLGRHPAGITFRLETSAQQRRLTLIALPSCPWCLLRSAL